MSLFYAEADFTLFRGSPCLLPAKGAQKSPKSYVCFWSVFTTPAPFPNILPLLFWIFLLSSHVENANIFPAEDAVPGGAVAAPPTEVVGTDRGLTIAPVITTFTVCPPSDPQS